MDITFTFYIVYTLIIFLFLEVIEYIMMFNKIIVFINNYSKYINIMPINCIYLYNSYIRKLLKSAICKIIYLSKKKNEINPKLNVNYILLSTS